MRFSELIYSVSENYNLKFFNFFDGKAGQLTDIFCGKTFCFHITGDFQLFLFFDFFPAFFHPLLYSLFFGESDCH